MKPATTMQPNDVIGVKVRVVDVKPSPDHKWFGRPHELINFEVVEGDGDVPTGLRFAMR